MKPLVTYEECFDESQRSFPFNYNSGLWLWEYLVGYFLKLTFCRVRGGLDASFVSPDRKNGEVGKSGNFQLIRRGHRQSGETRQLAGIVILHFVAGRMRKNYLVRVGK